jgi:hypothetical protein
MSSYTKDQKKIVVYYDGHDYLDVPSLALRAVKYINEKGAPDCLLTYGDNDVTLYVKKNKAGVTVRQLG